MRLEQITVQAFRGYPSKLEVFLSGDVVLLYGENGTGKTSLTEAFEWALFNSIVRKERSKTRGEFHGSSWIRSVHAAPDVETFVEVVLSQDGKQHTIRRVLTGNTTELTIDGKPAADVTALSLRTEDAFRPFLGQCEIQALIDSEQQSRWEQLSAILGFGGFGQLRERLQRLRTDTDADERIKRLRDRVTRAVQPLTPAGADPLEQSPDDLRSRAAGFLDVDKQTGWSDIRSKAQGELDGLLVKDRRPAGLDVLVVGVPDPSEAVSRSVEVVEQLMDHAKQHRDWHERNRRSAFAKQGLELIDSEHEEVCPFCTASTLDEDRIQGLRDQAQEATEPVPADPTTALRDALQSLLADGPLNEQAVEPLIESLGEDDDVATLQAARTEQAELNQVRDKVRRLADAAIAAYATASRPDGDPTGLQGLVPELRDAFSEFGQRHAALRAQLEAVALRLIGRFSGLDPEAKERLAALQMAVLLAENGAAVEAAWKLRGYQEILRSLVNELETGEKTRMAAALKMLSSDIARYYEELSPGHHIKISGISVRDTKRRQAALSATSHGKSVNPVTMFSEAEGNCLGLSLYFSQRVDRNPGWKMIMLDDPVQSMDQGHEEGLINLLARISRERQVVVMTHSKRFSEQVEAQFAPLDSFTKFVFERGSGPDPSVFLAQGRLDELLRYAEANAYGELVSRESCAGAVRKAVERFSRELAAHKGVTLRKGLSVEKMIDHLRNQQKLDDLDAGTLHRLRKFGNRGSHDDETVNPASSAILSNVNALKDLRERYLVEAGSKPDLEVIEGGGEAASDAAS